MPLTQQQIDQLNVASQRVAEGYGSDTDRTNIDYATRTFGYSYTPPAQTPPPAQNTPPPPSTPNTPANVYGDVLGAETPQEKALRLEQERQGAEYGTVANQVIDEEAIRLATEQRFQAEIDSLNRIYAEKKNAERLKGRGRLGTDTAIQSRRGLIGSTFGESQTNVIEDKNLQAESAVDDELNFELSQVRAKIRKEASDEVLAKRQAKKEGASSYMEFLAGQAERAANKVSNAVKSILSKVTSLGGVVDWNNPELVQIAKDLGISVGDLKRRYEEEEATQKSAAAEAEFKNRTKLSPGESMYDSDGNLLFTAPDKPSSANPKDNIFSDDNGTWQYLNGAWELVDAKDRSTTGPNSYQEWTLAGGLAGTGQSYAEFLAKSTGGKVVKINGIDYIQDADGNFTQPKVPETPVNQQYLDSLQTKYNDIASLLGDKYSGEAVGIGFFDRRDFNPLNQSKKANFIAGVAQLIDQKTLDTLIALKAAGGTLGAISEKELSILQNSATKISSWADKDDGGNIKGFKIGDADFKRELQKIQESYKKIIDAAKTQQPSDQYNWERSQLQPGEILIRDKATGEVGGIPEGEFDPNLYEQLGFNKDLSRSGNGSDDIKKIASAIGQFESGGNYKAKGPTVTSGMYKGDNAYGKYQIMGKNIASWSKQALGRSISLGEFLNNPKLQDKIAEYKMGNIYKQYGNVEDVASIWFSGRPVAKAGNAKDVLGTTVPKYIKNVRSIYNKLG